MNYNQNDKLSQIKPSTLIVGIDIAKDKHVARAQDDRGFEFGKRLIFDNRIHGFEQLLNWIFQTSKRKRQNRTDCGRRAYWPLLVEPCLLSESKRHSVCVGQSNAREKVQRA